MGQLQARPMPNDGPLHHWVLSRMGNQTPDLEKLGWVLGVGTFGIQTWSPTAALGAPSPVKWDVRPVGAWPPLGGQ